MRAVPYSTVRYYSEQYCTGTVLYGYSTVLLYAVVYLLSAQDKGRRRHNSLHVTRVEWQWSMSGVHSRTRVQLYKALQSQTRLARRGRIQLFQLSWMSLRVRLAPNVRNTAKNGQRDSDPIPQWEMSLRMILRTPYISYVIHLYMYMNHMYRMHTCITTRTAYMYRLCTYRCLHSTVHMYYIHVAHTSVVYLRTTSVTHT